MKKSNVFIVFVVAALIAGCASSRSTQVYSRDQARQVHSVRMGTVELVKPVRVEGTKSGIGAVIGGVAGGVAASTIGGGDGARLAALGGALAGAAVGALAEEKITDLNALEIIVRLDDGAMMAIVQKDDVMFFVGERIRVLVGPDGVTRVAK